MCSLSFVSIEKSWMFIEVPINLLDFGYFPLEIHFCTFFSFCKHFICSVICKFVTHIIDFILNFIPCSNVMVVKFIAVEFFPSFSLSGYQDRILLSKHSMSSTFIWHQINEVMHIQIACTMSFVKTTFLPVRSIIKREILMKLIHTSTFHASRCCLIFENICHFILFL